MDNNNRRVVITGMGAISPIGNDLPTIWDNLMKGYCGIDFIKSFDATDLPVKIAAELKDFDPEACGVDKALSSATTVSPSTPWRQLIRP